MISLRWFLFSAVRAAFFDRFWSLSMCTMTTSPTPDSSPPDGGLSHLLPRKHTPRNIAAYLYHFRAGLVRDRRRQVCLKLRPTIKQKSTQLGLVGYVRRNLKHLAQDFASFCSQTIRGSFPASLSGVVGVVPKVGLLLRLSQILSSAACTFPTSTPVN